MSIRLTSVCNSSAKALADSECACKTVTVCFFWSILAMEKVAKWSEYLQGAPHYLEYRPLDHRFLESRGLLFLERLKQV
jgi:hypothetical protein